MRCDNYRFLVCDMFGVFTSFKKKQGYIYTPFFSENPVLETIFSLSKRFSHEIVLKVIANTELSILQLSNMAYKTHVQ